MWVKGITTAAVLSIGAAGTAFADHGNGRGGYWNGAAYGQRGATEYVYARVVDVDPMVRYVTVDRPHRECWNEVVSQPVRPFGAAGPTVAGGIVGAAIGRQFGSGNDREALTLIGAVAGAAVANQRAVRNGANVTRDVEVERCELVSERVTEQHIDGYLVTYQYQGRRYTMQTATPPGDEIRLAVDVRPVGYRVRY